MSSAPRSQSWWAATPAAGRRGLIGGALLVVSLVIVSVFVWVTPGGATPPPSLDAQLAASQAENADLQEKLDDAQAKLDAARKGDGSTPTPTPTPAPTPAPTPTAAPEAPTIPESETIVVYRDPKSEGQPHPTAPPKPPVPVAPVPVTAPSIASILSPESRYFGMYTSQAPFDFSTFDDAAMDAGSRQSLVGYFGGWDQTYRGDVVTASWKRGLLPMLTWESRPISAPNDQTVLPEYSLPRILGGDFDAYLHQYAKDIVATGLPLAIRLDHEMNGTWYPWSEQKSDGSSLNGNGPGDFVAMWRHVHDIFAMEGANQFVIWTWAPNIINNLPARHQDVSYLQSLYPGDEYVDLIGASGYLRTPFKPANDFTFGYTFDATLGQLRTITDKPIIIAEVGATETGGHKAAWVASMFDAFADPANDDIIGFAWFNLAVTTISGGERITNDWRIDSRADSLAAFREGLADPAGRFRLIPY